MPVESSPLVDHYVLLTRNLLASAKSDGLADLSNLFDAREQVILQFADLNLSDDDRQKLIGTNAMEAELQATIASELELLRQILCGNFQEKRGVTGYLTTESQIQGDDSIAC